MLSKEGHLYSHCISVYDEERRNKQIESFGRSHMLARRKLLAARYEPR